MDTGEILKQRTSVHGDFKKQFAISARLKQVFDEYLSTNLQQINDLQNLYVIRESLDMIAVKLSRVFSGVPDYRDHWDDIAGYAKIVANHIQYVEEAKENQNQ